MSLFIDEIIEENERLKEKIEELKEELEIAKNNYKSLEWHNNNQYKLLIKYMNAIKIIKEKCPIVLDYHNPKTIETLDDYKYISDEEYDLLKEVLGDD